MDSTPSTTPANPFLIVGVGASAGGLEALEQLFHALPAEPNMAFVVIQHLSPDFESKMPELMGRQVSTPIHLVTDGMKVEPNAIYFIPPRKEMIISGGRLLLTERDDVRGFSLPIDHFFRSLAHDAGRAAVAVILSGAGSDGSRGLRDVHEAGGLVISQEPGSAHFQGMPLSARQTGVVDLVLRPEAIPAALARHAQASVRALHDAAADADPRPPAGSGLDQILRLLHSGHGIDFAFYKPSTVVRRIERRLSLAQKDDVEAYARLLASSPEELNALYQDLLIGVTCFFRDPEAFEQLETNVIPRILTQVPPDQEIRVWAPGCATGEEIYSLAIAFHEQLTAAGRPPNVRLFATDVHRASLDAASAGLYDEDALAEMPEARRQRYFAAEGHRWRVSKELRHLVVFARHNLIADAPFTRLDLVTCRNLLIYLQPAAQRKALSLFHFGLKTGGTLFLGPSETPGDLSDEFEVLHTHWKIYRKRRELRIHDPRLPMLHQGALPAERALTPVVAARGNVHLMHIYDEVLDRVMPCGMLVDEHFQLVHAFAGAQKLLRLKSGRPSISAVDLVEEGLKGPLLAALQHAQKTHDRVQYGDVTLTEENGNKTPARLHVEPVQLPQTRVSHYLVRIEPSGPPVAASEEVEVEPVPTQPSSDYVSSLESELRYAKENLQATIEELETANEELQATNEELVASNEELQSTNEELHSVNEELYTVNVEHQRKIVQLTETTDDLDNLLHSLDVGVLFLDENLCIRKFTAQIGQVFRLIPQDVGRRFDSFAHTLQHPGLQDDVKQVLHTGEPVQRQVTSSDGSIFLLRVLRYHGRGNQGGVLVTLVEVSALKQSEARVRRLSEVVESCQDAILALDPEGRITGWNRGALQLFGYSVEEAMGRPVTFLAPDGLRDELTAQLARVKGGEQVEPYETVGVRQDGRRVDVWATLSPIQDEHNRVVGVSVLGRDITLRKQQESEIRQALKMREEFLAMLSHELRNPLAALLNATGLVQKDGVSAQRRHRALEIIERQCAHMARLLDDLLDVSRMRQGGIDLRRQRIDMASTIQTAIERVRAVADESGVTLAHEAPTSPVWVYADPDRLEQVEVNLLTNAIKHTPSRKRVQVTLGYEGQRAVMRVEDEGMGIASEMLERIFDPFVRDQEPIHPNRQASAGLGLGLALVRSIVRGHGGEVRAHSRGLTHGSCFVVSLPALEGEAKTGAEPAYPTELTPAERTVVLVEDQEDSREVLCEYLTQEGWRVHTAATGKAAVEAILRERPLTAVVDVGLPDISGIDVAKAVRAALGSKTPYLIALTGYGQHRDAEAVLEAGFQQHLVKPASIPRLLELMRLRPRRDDEPAKKASGASYVHIVAPSPAPGAEAIVADPTIEAAVP